MWGACGSCEERNLVTWLKGGGVFLSPAPEDGVFRLRVFPELFHRTVAAQIEGKDLEDRARLACK